jgi:predicted HTH transcriptional regulator
MIIKTCIEQGLRSPDFQQDENFVVTLWRNEEGRKKTHGSSKKTVEIIADNPQITQAELAKMTGLTRRGIEWNHYELADLRLRFFSGM